ncbi:MBL fold metallo-hydrolase [Nocardioides sp. Y6]|uniref:MBL fold metallo-hydrolase n=1 Tax=Nocardioides malaquae TaxID=2773426 RepID=A0ABR9RRB2_9ACTN|nr:MBL fold metallo-hydrolase [Nocardioides malaquae]MBE7323685.1 MBL fold metallo-hydrolase [Nocardioides malaquae]
MRSPFLEVADRVWVSRRPWLDTTVGLVAGSAGVMLVDTHGSAEAGRAVVADVEALGLGPVTAVVTTHWHFDHTFGLEAVVEAWDGPTVWAHETAAEEFARHAESCRDERARAGHPESSDHHEAVGATRLVAPDATFSSVRVLDLGDRLLELVHPGRGHTGGDLVVNVPDAAVTFVGDLVEEAGPPSYGPDSYPLEWPTSLDVVIGLLRPDSLVVPGHGATVDREFVQDQRAAIGIVAETIRDLAGRGVRAPDALAAGTWPFPAEGLREAVDRAYAQLPRHQRSLPLA